MKPQLKLLIDYFKSGKTLTCFTAYHLGIGSLTKRISEIKNMDIWEGDWWEVWDEWVEQPNGKKHKLYGMRKMRRVL